MKLSPVFALAALGALALPAAQAGAAPQPDGPLPGTVQRLGITYSGFQCPTSPIHLVSRTPTTLHLTAQTNLTDRAVFEIASLGVRVPVPWAFSAVTTVADIGPLPAGRVPFRIVAPPTTGSYGPSCEGAFDVRPF
ncbi:MAG: hypothetical protein HOQ24_03520 [Mycobacteriaceae bacterium]|nr:hypothetical protein [Mycobacteriaceae bacterium]